MAKKNREKLGKKPGKIEPHPKIINTTKHKHGLIFLFSVAVGRLIKQSIAHHAPAASNLLRPDRQVLERAGQKKKRNKEATRLRRK